ncbi:MAG: hypothetical protein JSV16_07115 [Candidatus Hydrogenedentota bacterium]|nr:MAG: hypothetical protein JSV16_07115 [Candidatus Hydrogenedentota bacterium]
MRLEFCLDRLTGEVSRPWVRLHATKGCFDMLSLLVDFPEIKATFNVVPSLVTQIHAYRAGEVEDRSYEYSLVPAKELTADQKKFVLTEFFASLQNERIVVMRLPGEGVLNFTVPDKNFEMEMCVV